MPGMERVSHKMFETAARLTAGYAAREFEMWISAQGIMYLHVHNIVYNVDLDGGYIVCRKEDGTVIPS